MWGKALGTAALFGAPFLVDYGLEGLGKLRRNLDQERFSDELRRSTFAPGPLASRMRAERIQRNMAINEARLAMYSPHTYQELAAGRRIPKGTVAIVGQPRRDLLEEISYLMSTLPDQQGPEDETARRLSEIAGGL